jgi:hypothetical protein
VTRISYQKLKDNVEVSNLMLTKDGKVIFVEIYIHPKFLYLIKDIEGECLVKTECESVDEAKRSAREKCLELGVLFNEEIRRKEE